MRLDELIAFTEISSQSGDIDKDISSVTYDSRKVKKDSLFVAIDGFKSDGHKYIEAAIANGAAAIVMQNPSYKSDRYTWFLVPDSRKALADLSAAYWDFPSQKLNVIGVTGTNGKTTTTNLITTILEEHGYSTGLSGTIHNRLGQEITPVERTTGEAPELQELLHNFLSKGAKYAVMEVSSHALDLHRVRGLEFDVAVFTNLTQDHLDFHSTMEKYLAAKAKLFQVLGQNVRKKRGKYAIINNDDPVSQQLAEMTSVPVITYGMKNKADVRAEQVKVTAAGVSYQLRYKEQLIPVNLKLTGVFNVYNSLAAISVGLVENIPISSIINSLERIPGISGRLEKVEAGQDFTVIVDYCHTPDGLDNCLRTAREIAEGRVITVFGCGGDRDRTKRPIMGEVAGHLSDLVIVTSDNPRTEEPQRIIQDILPGLKKAVGSKEHLEEVDRRKAIYTAVQKAQKGDVVVIAGKGHEDYQIIGDRVFPFDDRQVALEAIKERLNN